METFNEIKTRKKLNSFIFVNLNDNEISYQMGFGSSKAESSKPKVVIKASNAINIGELFINKKSKIPNHFSNFRLVSLYSVCNSVYSSPVHS